MSIRFGTCSFTAKGWEGAFYPRAIPRTRWLEYYATRFDAVEIDSSFYAIPRRDLVRRWSEITPDEFRFTFKAPRQITHETIGSNLGELSEFFEVLEPLGSKLAAVLFQFPYFRKDQISSVDEFMERAWPIFSALPHVVPAVVELRNRSWISPTLVRRLAADNLSLALIDHPYTGTAHDWQALLEETIAEIPLTYVRLLGDRYAIEEKTTVWYRVVESRDEELAGWASLLSRNSGPGAAPGYLFANNHYEGFAVETIEKLRRLL